MRGRLLALAMLLGVLLVPGLPALADHADWHADWDEDAEGIEAGVGVETAGFEGSPGGSSGYWYVWTADPCSVGGDPYVGDDFWVLVFGPGDELVDEFCADPNAEPLPTPPTVTEIFDHAPLPPCEIGISPVGEGLTGMETWLWCENVDRPVEVTVTIRGFRVQVSASPTEYHWIMGDGINHVSKSAGTEQDPSATHVYETKDEYVVRVDVVWTGTYTYTGHGVTETGSLGEVSSTSDVAYPVVEVRGVLER